MPELRAPWTVPLPPALLGPGTTPLPREPHLTPAAAYLPRLVATGGAPTAALPARRDSPAPYDVFRSTGPGIRRADRFRAGSVTKTFVAVVVLQLAGEGRLRLSGTVDRLPPGLVRGNGHDGRRITLRALLDRNSGLPDHTAVGRPVPADAAVRLALTRRPANVPGGYARSNTDYAVLGLVVRRVTGHGYAEEIRRRVISPPRPGGTSLPGARTTLPAPHGRGFTRDPADGTLRDVTVLDPRAAGAAGELISTLADPNRFYAALLGGRLPRPARRAALLDTAATHGVHGLGVHPQRLSCGVTARGHNGHIAGSHVRSAATRDGRHTLTFRVDTDALADAPALERALLDAEFCPGSPGSPAAEGRAARPGNACRGGGRRE